MRDINEDRDNKPFILLDITYQIFVGSDEELVCLPLNFCKVTLASVVIAHTSEVLSYSKASGKLTMNVLPCSVTSKISDFLKLTENN